MTHERHNSFSPYGEFQTSTGNIKEGGLEVAGVCLGTYHMAKKNFVSQGTLDSFDQNRRTRLNGRAELFRELRHKTMCAKGGQGGRCARNL